MSRRVKLLLVSGYVVLFAALLRYLSVGQNMGILDPKGYLASEEKNLIFLAVALMLIVVVPVYIMTFAFTWRYRSDNQDGTYTPSVDHNSLEEFIWWAIPCMIILVLAGVTWTSTHHLDPYRPLDSNVPAIEIQVVALDWKWLFIYPDAGIATVNYVEFPVDTPIEFKITSDAPMNSFWIPQLAGQIYAMAGMSTKLHVIADEPGSYRGLSSNFSGEGFSGMKFTAKAVSKEEYDGWLYNARTLPTNLSRDAYEDLAKPSKNAAERTYGNVAFGLYDAIIAKYMLPKKAEAMGNTPMRHTPLIDPAANAIMRM